MVLPPIHLRAIKVAVVVGTALAGINYGDKLLENTMTHRDWLKLCLTYLVPYCVSVYSAYAARRPVD